MDDPNLDRAVHRRALAGLRRINAWSQTARVLAAAMARIASERSLRALKVLDVACGGGDIALHVANRLSRAGLEAEVHGCDISQTAIDHATANAAVQGVSGARFYVHNALEQVPPDGYDIITSTLFLHHLTDSDAVRLLRNLATATRHALLVDDLVRNRRGYWLAQLGCRLLSRSPVVHYDGPASVLGAYTLAEARQLASAAGLEGAVFTKHWPERYLMTYKKAP